MAVYESKYRGLTFYVNDRCYSFNDGQFASDDPEVIAKLDVLTDAKRIDEPEVLPEPKPATKAASKPKASAK